MKLKLTAKSLWTNGEMVARSVHSNDRWETDFNHKLHSYLQVAALRPSALNPKCFLAFEVITQETWNSFLGTRKRWWWLGMVNVDWPRVKLCLTNLLKWLDLWLSAKQVSFTLALATFPNYLQHYSSNQVRLLWSGWVNSLGRRRGLYNQEHGQQIEGSIFPSLLTTCWITSSISPPNSRKTTVDWNKPIWWPWRWPGTGKLVLGGYAEGMKVVLPWEKPLGDLIHLKSL